jgi:hypothetical protein
MSWVITGTYKGAAVSDADAQAYLRAVEQADNQGPLEQGVQQAVNQFVIGCKADGIWGAIKASCILAGARTLTGALVPLVGTAPTNFNFVSGDYNRKTGLVGNGSTKYLNSNRNNNADPQDSKHIATFVSTAQISGGGSYMAGGTFGDGDSSLLADRTANILGHRVNNGAGSTGGVSAATQFIGASRSSSSDYIFRFNSTSSTLSASSVTPRDVSVLIFARRNADIDAPALLSNARLAFYSIGESLNLTQLDARVTDLINAFAAAIP